MWLGVKNYIHGNCPYSFLSWILFFKLMSAFHMTHNIFWRDWFNVRILRDVSENVTKTKKVNNVHLWLWVRRLVSWKWGIQYIQVAVNPLLVSQTITLNEELKIYARTLEIWWVCTWMGDCQKCWTSRAKYISLKFSALSGSNKRDRAAHERETERERQGPYE